MSSTCKIRLTKFIETKLVRFRLQRTIKITHIPHPGWLLCGYAKCPTVELVVEKLCYDRRSGLVECIIKPSNMELHDDEARNYIKDRYGNKWAVDEIYLTQEGLREHMEKRKGRAV